MMRPGTKVKAPAIKRALLVGTGEPAITDDVSNQNRC